MKRDVEKKQANPGAKTKVITPAAKVQTKKPQAEIKKLAPKSAKMVSGKIVKQTAKIKLTAETPKPPSISKETTSKKSAVAKRIKPKTHPQKIENLPVKPQTRKKTSANKKVEKPHLKTFKKTADSQKSKPQPPTKNPPVSLKKTKVFLKIVESVKAVQKKPARKKPVKPIGVAVFRGIKQQYDFKVFQINEEFEAVKAVYIISKRKTDRQKRGHHKLVCIGQTDSIFEEIKKHRKSRCLRQNEANVISLLPEENESKRLKIETDLKAAHSISCNLA
ncbi:hypothetical protein BH10ACI1_BH10ACI1_26870 [soil metagenome]